MKRKQGGSRHDDGNSEGDGGDEYAKKVRAAGPDICDDVLLSIFSRLTSRDAARCAALSKHHRHRICDMDFWLLHRRLTPPLPRPHIAYMSTVGASSDPNNVRRRPAAPPLPDRVLPGCMFLDFHLAGGRPGDDNDDLRYSLIDRVHLHQKYVGTCDGVILMAPERFNGGASILLFNPAIAGSEVEVRVELPFLLGHGRYRVSGFGYGPSRTAHKLLLISEESTALRPAAISYHAKELLVYTLGARPSAAGNQERQRSVLSELDANISGDSVCLDGKIYLLADHSRVLEFNVDNETVTTIGLPTAGGKHAASKHSKLVEVSGRLCLAAGDAGELAMWLLAADRQWVRLCEFRCGGGPGTAGKLAGAWDCGGVLLLYFKHRCTKTAYLHLYDTREDKELQKVTVPRAVAAEQDGSGLVVCWGYRPTLVSPESIVGAPPRQRGAGAGVLAALEPLVKRDVDTGRERTLEAVCFMNLLLYFMRKLPGNAEDVDREIKHRSLPFSLR